MFYMTDEEYNEWGGEPRYALHELFVLCDENSLNG